MCKFTKIERYIMLFLIFTLIVIGCLTITSGKYKSIEYKEEIVEDIIVLKFINIETKKIFNQEILKEGSVKVVLSK